MKKITLCSTLLTATLRLLRLTVCAIPACLALEASAGTTYVISTDGAPLSTNYLQAIGASQGLSTPGFVFLSPTTLGPINGTPINFGGYSNNTAYFGVVGSLNLSNAARI